MEALLGWGTRVIQAVQAWGNPTLDAVFRAITMLGDEKFYLLLVPLLYWAVDKGLALRAGVLYLASAYVNTWLKAAFAIPRPSPTSVRVLDNPEGWSFPSGHAQSTTTAWTYLAVRLRKRWLWWVAGAMVVLVGLSRVYLGVHYPQDVIVGTGIGLLLVALYSWLETRFAARLFLPFWGKLVVGVGVPLLMLALHAETDTGSAMGTLIGLGVGVTLEREWVRFSTAGSLAQRAVRFLTGLLVLLGLYFGLKAILPATLIFRVLRYGLIGMWVAFIAPWVFVRLGLAHRE